MSSTPVARSLRIATWLLGTLVLAGTGGCEPETQLTPRRKRAIEVAVAKENGDDIDNAWVDEDPLVPGLFVCGHTTPPFNPAIRTWSRCLARGWRIHCDDEMMQWVLSEYRLTEHPDRFSPEVWARLVAHEGRFQRVETAADVDACCRKQVGSVEPRVTALDAGGVEVSATAELHDHHAVCTVYSRFVFRADAQHRTSWKWHELCRAPSYPSIDGPSCDCGPK